MGIATDSIHAGQQPDPTTGAIMTPIYQTSTYVQEELGVHKGYEYARTHNLTRAAWEQCVAKLEGATTGIAFGSGLAAIGTLIQALEPGDHVVSSNDMYGGTYRLYERVYRRYGIEFEYVDTSDLDAVRAAIRPTTRLLYVETPSNPLMKVSDLAALAEMARARGIALAVDNTFLTPFFQRPLELGAHLVVHSVTKYLNGHSDMVGGMLLTSEPAWIEKLRFLQNAAGAVPGPMDCWLALRGVKTLAVRMPRHEANAMLVAQHLVRHPRVERVLYPGLPEHPAHALSTRQTSGFGGMVSFLLRDLEEARQVAGRTRLFALAESLGGVESLLCHPASMTHASVPRAERERMGFTDGLLRLSVGIEDVEDLLQDLDHALAV
ncbi:MAG: aminotransferase class I/II-fold pyridoxal phosphate-dependent enzyme [Candidatus Eisenbacteria bacterium]|nr:aminotransferase class I/II-fold pyridoxal phosphate-dependent enzyme [Candidatus Eisenbacteria bacterium]MCC7144140.1 aminotransferase class I/II-fold pyridoxal phosphate-dependent enzyme [Candidatus Eisenbacteria bacterium]